VAQDDRDGRAHGGEDTRRLWNERHSAAVFNDRPAAWLAEHEALLERQPRGRTLDIACGGGRNAYFLSDLGFEVDALDISDVAVERVRLLGGERIIAQRVDLADAAAFPRPPYEVVLDFFYLERPLFDPIASALAPDGLLLFETFVADPGDAGSSFRLQPGELRRAFADRGLEILDYDEVAIGDDVSGRRTVARLAARRPSRDTP
jgi:SAM-dependent methyltransferase